MRGSPLLRALVAFAALALLGWPVWQVTHARKAAAPVAASAAGSPARIMIAVSFTLPPAAIRVSHSGKELFAVSNPEAAFEREVELPWPKEGVDLHLTIDWPADAPLAAARVRVTDGDGREHEKSIWSAGPADEVLTFP